MNPIRYDTIGYHFCLLTARSLHIHLREWRLQYVGTVDEAHSRWGPVPRTGLLEAGLRRLRVGAGGFGGEAFHAPGGALHEQAAAVDDTYLPVLGGG